MKIQHSLLVESFKKLTPHKARFTNVFYYGLFRQCPEYESMFAGVDWSTQKQMLVGALSLVVKYTKYGTQDPEMMKVFMQLGTRHAKYKIQEKHFEPFVFHLLYAMKLILRKDWTLELEENWRKALWEVCSLMVKAIEAAQTQDTFTSACYLKQISNYPQENAH